MLAKISGSIGGSACKSAEMHAKVIGSGKCMQKLAEVRGLAISGLAKVIKFADKRFAN
jgi:hypothetical protein